jgi:hypothetical protein
MPPTTACHPPPHAAHHRVRHHHVRHHRVRHHRYAGSNPNNAVPDYPIPIGGAIYNFFGVSYTASHQKTNMVTTKFEIYEKVTDAVLEDFSQKVKGLSTSELEIVFVMEGLDTSVTMVRLRV